MIVYITEPFMSTKIRAHVCFSSRIRRPHWSSFESCVLEISRTCVFQGGIKMHDRSTLLCLPQSPIGILLWYCKVSTRVTRNPSNIVLAEIHLRSSRSLLPILAP